MKKECLWLVCLISTITVTKQSEKKNSDTDSVIFLNLSTPENEYQELIRTEIIPLKATIKAVPSVNASNKRLARDLRIPFRQNRRPVETQVSPKPPPSQQASPRVFSHPKIRPVPISEMSQSQQKHYRPAYSQGSLHRPNQQSPRTFYPRNQKEIPRQQTMPRGPPRPPNRDNVPRQQTRHQVPNDGGQERRPVHPNMASSPGPIPPRQSSSPFSPSIDDEIINSESQGHHTRSRIIDVYHHVPVRSNQDMYSGFSGAIHAPKPPVETQSLHQMQPYFKQPPPQNHFVSPRPTMSPQMFHQSSFVPQSFTDSPRNAEFSKNNQFQPQLFDEMPKAPNMNHRYPVNPPPRPISVDRKPPFEYKFAQNEPTHAPGHLSQNNFPGKSDTSIPPQFHPQSNNQMQSDARHKGDSQSHSVSTEKPGPDPIVDDKLKIIETVEKSPTNGTGTVKKYWDFRQANAGHSVPHLHVAPSVQKVIQSKPALSDSNKFYQGQESVSSLSVKDNPHEVKNWNVFSDESYLVLPQSPPLQNEPSVLKSPTVSNEFYHIDDKHKSNTQNSPDAPPHFVHISVNNKEQKLPLQKVPVNMKEISAVIHTSENTTPKYSPDASGTKVQSTSESDLDSKYYSHSQSNEGYRDSLPLLDEELKYIPADIFRRNLTVSTGSIVNINKHLEHSLGHVSSSVETTTRIPVRPAASHGIYARNKAQFQKFEETTQSSFHEHSPENSASSDTEPKQYFRGPQHVTNNWTILEDHHIAYGEPRRLVSTSIQPNFNSLLLIPTTAMPHKYGTPAQSVHSHRKVINALHLANKVFGRRNNTRTFTISTTEKPEPKRFRFTYAPLPRSSTENEKENSEQSDSKQFFNFKTGTTHSVPQSSSSDTKIEGYVPRTHDEMRIRNGVNSPQYNYDRTFNAETRPGHKFELFNTRRNNSTSNDNKRLYYINLKPVTRPYVFSTTNLPTTSAVPRLKPTKYYESSTPYSIVVDISKMHSTKPSFHMTESTTTKSEDRYFLPTSQSTFAPYQPLSTTERSEVKTNQNVASFTNMPVVKSLQSSTTTSSSTAQRISTTQSTTTERSIVQRIKTTPRNIVLRISTTPSSIVQRINTTPRNIVQRINTTLRSIVHRINTIPETSTIQTSSTTQTSSTAQISSTTQSSTTERSSVRQRTSTTQRSTTKSSTTTQSTNIRNTAVGATRRTAGIAKHHVTMSPLPPSIPISKAEVVTANVINQEDIIVESLKSMKVKTQEMLTKGMRHLMPMIMELSSDVSISSDCTFSLFRWLRGIRTFEQWAVRMMDASSKMPEGILFGTMSTFGSYDECIAVQTPKSSSQISYTGQYCSINIQPILPENEHHFTIQNAFRRYPKLKKAFQEMNIDEETMAYYYILKHRIGLCIPSTCNMDDLQNVTEKMADHLMMKISVGHCETSEKPSFTRGQIISIIGFYAAKNLLEFFLEGGRSGVIVAFIIVILGTILDLLLRHRLDHDMDIEEIVRKKSSLRQFSYAFSAYRNACKILTTSIPTNHISAIHGIKFLSLTWIMLGHVYYCKDYLTLAGLNRVRDLGSNMAFQVVLNTAFAADTFFFLSGLLVVYSSLQYLENTDGHFTIVGFYIKRYCRLTPAFLMISGVILLGPLAGSGPIWNETLEPFVTGCQNYWWTNLFYFSNFIPTAKTCVPHGWFISCDMQFYLISPVIILALYRRPKMGLTLIGLGIITSMAATGFLTFMYNLPPVSLFSLPDPRDINEYLDTMGYKPYAHYSAYCVGMATGFILAAKQKIAISKSLQVFGWCFSIIGCTLVVYGTWKWNSGILPDWAVSVAYATASRTVWSLGIAWLTVVCYAGYGGTINDILCWHGFIPLSRLSYLAYLIHPLLMYLYASYIRTPFYFSQYVMIYLYFGHLCVTFGIAFLFSLAFERPFLNLEKIVSRRLDQSRRKRRASFSHHHSNWQHPEYPEIKDSVVLMRRRTDRFIT